MKTIIIGLAIIMTIGACSNTLVTDQFDLERPSVGDHISSYYDYFGQAYLVEDTSNNTTLHYFHAEKICFDDSCDSFYYDNIAVKVDESGIVIQETEL